MDHNCIELRCAWPHPPAGRAEPQVLYRHEPPRPRPSVAMLVWTIVAIALATATAVLIAAGGTPTEARPTDLTSLTQRVSAINPAMGAAFATPGTAEATTAKVCEALPVLGEAETTTLIVDSYNVGSGYAFPAHDVTALAALLIDYCPA